MVFPSAEQWVVGGISTGNGYEVVQKNSVPDWRKETRNPANSKPIWPKSATRGFGLDLEETAEGACCIGAPIRDLTGTTIGAISVSMDSGRFYQSASRFTSIVKSTAAQLSTVSDAAGAGMSLGCRNTPIQRF